MLLKLGPGWETADLSPDLRALADGVSYDHRLLQDRVRRLTGPQGLRRLRAALTAARAAVKLEHDAMLATAAAEIGTSADVEPPLGAANTPSLSLPPMVTPLQLGPQTPDPTAPSRRTPSQGFLRPRALFPVEPGTESASATPMRGRPVGATPVGDEGRVGGGSVGGGGGVGVEGRDGTDVKLGMIWELLHDPQWQLPSSNVEAAWKDALGETDVKQVKLYS